MKYIGHIYPHSNKNKVVKIDSDGFYHNDKGPAIISENGDKYWFIHGKLHRLDGPASEFADGGKEWFINDKQVHASSQEEFEKLIKLKIFW